MGLGFIYVFMYCFCCFFAGHGGYRFQGIPAMYICIFMMHISHRLSKSWCVAGFPFSTAPHA